MVPRVTIGLPVYNGEPFLAAAIDSILAQDFVDFELLIADNGSTDRTPAIVRTAAARDRRIIVHRSEHNHGAAWNYNRLVDLAQGEYFKWAAHDDRLEPQFLRRCVEILDARPEVVLCYSQVADIDEADNIIRHYDVPTYATEERPSQRVLRLLFTASQCCEIFGLVRRDALLKTHCIGRYAGSDCTLLLELALLGRFQKIHEALFWHREHSGRSMSSYANMNTRNIWFDPGRAGRITLPIWRMLAEYGLAIARSPIPRGERLRALEPWLRFCGVKHKILRHELVAIAKGKARADRRRNKLRRNPDNRGDRRKHHTD